MLDPRREFALPTIVQIAFDRESQLWLVLIPAMHYPKTVASTIDLHNVEAMWAGPLDIPSVGNVDVSEAPGIAA
jgi:hypothetical protein